MPEIPLSVGSKLLSLPNFRIVRYTSPCTHAFVRVCILRQRRRGFCTLVPSLTLGAHAQEGYGTCLVCAYVCVCVSVCTPAPTTLVSTLKMGYVGVYLRLFLLCYVWIFDKSFRSKVMARKSQYANEQLLLETGFSPFRVPCIHQ